MSHLNTSNTKRLSVNRHCSISDANHHNESNTKRAYANRDTALDLVIVF